METVNAVDQTAVVSPGELGLLPVDSVQSLLMPLHQGVILKLTQHLVLIGQVHQVALLALIDDHELIVVDL